MDSNTFQEIQASSEVIWRMQRYSLITEYQLKPFLVPPFILLAHAFLLVRYVFRHGGCRRRCEDCNRRFRSCVYRLCESCRLKFCKFGFREYNVHIMYAQWRRQDFVPGGTGLAS